MTVNATEVMVSAYADRSPARMCWRLGPDDFFKRGEHPGVLFGVPGVYDSMSPELQLAVRVRRRAGLTGQCPACDSELDIDEAADRVNLRHDDDCPAMDGNLMPLLRAWRQRFGDFALGRHLDEDPLAPIAGLATR